MGATPDRPAAAAGPRRRRVVLLRVLAVALPGLATLAAVAVCVTAHGAPRVDAQGHAIIHLVLGREADDWYAAAWTSAILLAWVTLLAALVVAVRSLRPSAWRVLLGVVGGVLVGALGVGMLVVLGLGLLLGATTQWRQIRAPDGATVLVATQEGDWLVGVYRHREGTLWERLALPADHHPGQPVSCALTDPVAGVRTLTCNAYHLTVRDLRP